MRLHAPHRALYSVLLCTVFAIIAAISIPQPLHAQTSFETVIDQALESLGETFEPGEVEAFAAFLASDAPDAMTGDTIGHLLFMRRHFDRAAWFFGTDARAAPDAASLSNFAATLAVTADDLGESAPAEWMRAAELAAKAAAALAPDDAAVQNNLGTVARLAGDPETAAAAARLATELDPNMPLFWSNLARALTALGDFEGAAQALDRARQLEPNGPAHLLTARALPQVAPSYSDILQNSCDVNFRCQEICPRSIIGGINSVTCEMEQMSATMACREGQPYPTSFDCSEDLPEYGILIPGLNSGFSILFPGVTIHVLVQGDGSVDVRVEGGVNIGPLNLYLRGDGHYSPPGGVAVDNVGGGASINLLPASEANRLVSERANMPPFALELEGIIGQSVDLDGELYGMPVIMF
ncbi:tetratricopeptide repeat protein [Maritalea mobilis]|uniref:tetratricopeptide repeat protein n=1 Tax=Maritalea mobilis TaxID=483324 RepID=UPI001C98370C|nr:tetratricopeptide repeat protein [Maritalea mobilis]MBY6200464.1 tetratricopeptide repeat protein [Maritalea mobilis]